MIGIRDFCMRSITGSNDLFHIKQRLFKTCKDYLTPGLFVRHIESERIFIFISGKLERVSRALTLFLYYANKSFGHH